MCRQLHIFKKIAVETWIMKQKVEKAACGREERGEVQMKVSRAFDANCTHTNVGQGLNRGFGREDFCAQTGRFTCFRVSFLTSLVSRIAVYITCMNYFYWMAIFPSIISIIATAVAKSVGKSIGTAMRFQNWLISHLRIHLMILSFHNPAAISSFCLLLNQRFIIASADQKQPLASSPAGDCMQSA